MRVFVTVFTFSLVAFACSSETVVDSSPTPSSGNTPSDCSCSVDVNGDKKVIACEKQACVAKVSYRCTDDAVLEEAGDACEKSDEKSSEPATKATTVACDGKTCDAATQYCIRSYAGGSTCAPLPSGCAECTCASADTETAWKKANGDTNNCTGMIACNNSNGAILVDCPR